MNERIFFKIYVGQYSKICFFRLLLFKSRH